MLHQNYKVVTLNVNGLHNPIKRSKAIAKMKREKQDVFFWQETHLSSVEHVEHEKLATGISIYSPPLTPETEHQR